jgi:hypothetical protein
VFTATRPATAERPSRTVIYPTTAAGATQGSTLVIVRTPDFVDRCEGTRGPTPYPPGMVSLASGPVSEYFERASGITLVRGGRSLRGVSNHFDGRTGRDRNVRWRSTETLTVRRSLAENPPRRIT